MLSNLLMYIIKNNKLVIKAVCVCVTEKKHIPGEVDTLFTNELKFKTHRKNVS